MISDTWQNVWKYFLFLYYTQVNFQIEWVAHVHVVYLDHNHNDADTKVHHQPGKKNYFDIEKETDKWVCQVKVYIGDN